MSWTTGVPPLSPPFSVPASLTSPAHLPPGSSLLTSGVSPRTAPQLRLTADTLPALLWPPALPPGRPLWVQILAVGVCPAPFGCRPRVEGGRRPALSPMTVPAALDSQQTDKTRPRNVPSPGSQGCLLNCLLGRWRAFAPRSETCPGPEGNSAFGAWMSETGPGPSSEGYPHPAALPHNPFSLKLLPQPGRLSWELPG